MLQDVLIDWNALIAVSRNHEFDHETEQSKIYECFRQFECFGSAAQAKSMRAEDAPLKCVATVFEITFYDTHSA